MESFDWRARLDAQGVLVIHDFVQSVAHFERLSRAWFPRFHQPATRVNARSASRDGYTSQVSMAGYLLGHAEGYYRPCLPPPDVCVFWCERAPSVLGGETTWIDAAALFQALPGALGQRLLHEPVVYEAQWDLERWQAEFSVENVQQLEKLLNADPRCRYTIRADGVLHLLFQVHAAHVGRDGVARFLNGLLAHLPVVSHSRYAGNTFCRPVNQMHWATGGVLKVDEIAAIIDAHDSALKKHRWRDGDLLVLDNHRVLHGREAMMGPDQRVIYSRFGYWK